MSIQRLLFQAKMSNYISKCTAVGNFNAYMDKKGTNQQSKNNLHFLSKVLACALCSCIKWRDGLDWPTL